MFTGPLSVFTLNLNIDRPDPAGDRLVHDEIQRLNPDIISFQEALWHGDTRDQARQILDGLSYETVHQFDLQEPDRPYGTAIASRFPIVRSDLVKLPSTSRGQEFPRAIQAAEIDATPDASSIRFLTGLKSLQGRSTCFVDAWVASGNTDPGHTWSCDNDFTRELADRLFGSSRVRRRIDYVLVGSPLLYKGFARTRDCQVVLDQPRDGIWASGHFGLLATFDVTSDT